jgi:hypothetical protein
LPTQAALPPETHLAALFNIKGSLIMTTSDPNSGWSDPIGTFFRLQLAVRILAKGDGPRKVRLNEATSALTELVPEYFPKAMREKAKRVLGVRDKIRCDHSSKLMSFPFDLLTPKECTALIQNILSLYEACLFDMTKEIKEIVRPDDQ